MASKNIIRPITQAHLRCRSWKSSSPVMTVLKPSIYKVAPTQNFILKNPDDLKRRIISQPSTKQNNQSRITPKPWQNLPVYHNLTAVGEDS